jgi:hypothetical protein
VPSAGTISKSTLLRIADAVGSRIRHVRDLCCARASQIYGEIAMATNENLTVHLKVKDYAAWRTGYDAREKNRVSAGITNGRVFRRAEDQNDVVILQDVADVAKARTWLASDEMKAAMEKGGVVGSPNIRFASAA